DGVIVDQRTAASSPAGEALGQHADHGRELLALQLPKRPGSLVQSQQLELAPIGAVDEGSAFDEIVPRQRDQPSLWGAVDRVTRAANALQEAGDRSRRAQLADQIDLADVDA